MTSERIHRTTIAGIPALWAEPATPGPRKLVIWLPGFSGSKDGMESYVLALAEAGFIGLSFDPYQHGERQIESLDALRSRVRGNIRRYFWPILGQTAEEVPLMIDWATKTLGVLPTVGIGGISMGGDISVAAAGLDHHIVAVAAGVATPDWLRPGSFEPPGEPDAAAQAWYDRRNPLTHLDDYRQGAAISFQCGADDRQVPPDGAQRFVSALRTSSYANQPDRLAVFLQPETAHQYTPAMWAEALRWFVRFV